VTASIEGTPGPVEQMRADGTLEAIVTGSLAPR